MKKILSLSVLALVCVGLASCGGGDTQSREENLTMDDTCLSSEAPMGCQIERLMSIIPPNALDYWNDKNTTAVSRGAYYITGAYDDASLASHLAPRGFGAERRESFTNYTADAVQMGFDSIETSSYIPDEDIPLIVIEMHLGRSAAFGAESFDEVYGLKAPSADLWATDMIISYEGAAGAEYRALMSEVFDEAQCKSMTAGSVNEQICLGRADEDGLRYAMDMVSDDERGTLIWAVCTREISEDCLLPSVIEGDE
jgi:hypothetical protein